MDDAAQLPGIAAPVGLAGGPSALPPCAGAYVFPAHPGLLVARRALTAEQQRRLVVDALTVFPDPPCHTNHTRLLGGLSGLWQAALAGLRLQQPAEEAAPAPPGSQPPLRTTRAAGHCSSSRSGQQGQQPATADIEGHRSTTSSTPSSWVAEGSGPLAAVLLRKLRWATLGPPFDWTNRVYLRDAEHRLVPPYLQQLAADLASLACRVADRGTAGLACHVAGACEDVSDGRTTQQEQRQLPASPLPLASHVACVDADRSSQQGQQGADGSSRQEHQPPHFDAALVNYYSEGPSIPPSA